MPRARIDRFTIDAGAMSSGEARQLGVLIAERLAGEDIVPGNFPRLSISVERRGSLRQLADWIVADALRQIRRAP